ncbi:MFS transporter [Saccharopolyspora shandongensis]|uniref:MFS transporter n=1 Tax=Saccharopolyspora shandongensis TaxID=418495 RepID=UPI0034043AC8
MARAIECQSPRQDPFAVLGLGGREVIACNSSMQLCCRRHISWRAAPSASPANGDQEATVTQEHSSPPGGGASSAAVRKATLRKITLRMMPILMLGYFVSYLDRINISFAKFGLTESFGLSATGYGFAAGIFFLGYILFEVPSNLILHRVGARIWISRIMITWGIIAAAIGFVPGTTWLYVMRFLLGVAEAGFFPGIILYLARWYPAQERSKAIAMLMTAIPLASALGGPVNGWILSAFEQVWGLEGWRWLFIIGGLPAVVLGVLFLLLLADSPDRARWLNEAERKWLSQTLAAEEVERRKAAPLGRWEVFRNGRVLVLTLVYFLLLCGAYPLTYWMPSVVKDIGQNLSSVQVGLISAAPFAAAAVAMYVTGRLIGRRHNSVVPTAVALAISVVAFVATAVNLDSPMIAFAAITVATMAAQTAKPLFWGLPTAYLSGAAAASGIALINSLGNLAGFISPYAVGWIKDASGGSNSLPMTVMVLANVLALVAVVALGLRSARRSTAVEPVLDRG